MISGGAIGCGGGGGDDEADDDADDDAADDDAADDDDANDTGDEPDGGIVDENGDEVLAVDVSDGVNLSLTGLTANSQYQIAVAAPDGTLLTPEGGLVATTDEEGNLPSSAVVQDLATSGEADALVLRGEPFPRRVKAQTGTYVVTITGDVDLTVNFSVVDRSKVFCTDQAGVARKSFLPTETVYAKIEKGDGDLVDGSFLCYARSDLGAILEDGVALQGTQVTISVSGGTGTGSLGTFSSVGPYDVVCDVNGNGTYEGETDLIARAPRFQTCFTVQNANSGEDIVGQVCADRFGNYKDIYDPNSDNSDIRDVFGWIAPSQQPLIQHAFVDKYVVAHQDEWEDGEPLVDVDSAIETDPVDGFCTNEAPWLIWPRPRLRAGCYDCIIDVNRNGVYDQGVDFLDNIDGRGDNTQGGMCVSDTACGDLVQITSHDDGDTVTTTAITLEGTLSEAVTSAYVVVTSGSQSSGSIALSLTATDSGMSFTGNSPGVNVIPLYINSENHLTVFAVKSNGTICSRTITLTSEVTGSEGVVGFQVQLIWDGSTDMDLHLVRPLGTLRNPSAGDPVGIEDCHYSNCKVGRDGVEGTGDQGEGNYTIDWGARQDVDCVSCGNGIENIWINAEDISLEGDYEVYVDAYSGNETEGVTVTVFVGGANVGTVSCGDMAAGTATDICFVGTWNSVTGNWAPDGSMAADF